MGERWQEIARGRCTYDMVAREGEVLPLLRIGTDSHTGPWVERETHDEACKRIAELEKERDSFYMDYRAKCDVETKALYTHNAALKKRLHVPCAGCPGCGSNDCPDARDLFESARQRIAELEALIGACHEAMGEDAGSDDASLPEVIAHYVRESNEEIAELEAALEQTKAEAHKGFEAYENLLEERWQEIARELRAQQARAELSEATEKRAVQAWKDEQANARRLFEELDAWMPWFRVAIHGHSRLPHMEALLDELRASYGEGGT